MWVVIDDALGLFDQLGVEVLVAEAAAQIAAEGRNLQVVVLEGSTQVVLEAGSHLFGGELAVGGVDLHAVSPHFGSDSQRFLPRKAERFEHNAKMKLFHGGCLLQYYLT